MVDFKIYGSHVSSCEHKKAVKNREQSVFPVIFYQQRD